MRRFSIFNFYLFFSFLFVFSQEIKVPIEFYENTPIVSVSQNGNTLYFLLESGSTYNSLYTSGIEKLIGDISKLYSSYYSAYKDKFSSCSNETEVKNILDQAFRDLSTKLELTQLVIQDYSLAPKSFRVYIDGNGNFPEKNGIVIDGIVNLSFFEDFKNLTLDYKGKQLILNSTKKMGKSVPLKKFNKIDSYAVSIKIDGVKQDALIGTGTNDFIIRSDYKSNKTYTDDELASAIELMLTHPYEEGYLVGSKRIEVAGQSANFFARHLSEGEIKSNPKFAALCEKINILGYPVLSSFIFTFDFENKRVFVREYEE